MYQSWYNPYYEYQTENDPHGYNPVNYQRHNTTGRDLVCYVNRTLAINCSMSQTGHSFTRLQSVATLQGAKMYMYRKV